MTTATRFSVTSTAVSNLLACRACLVPRAALFSLGALCHHGGFALESFQYGLDAVSGARGRKVLASGRSRRLSSFEAKSLLEYLFVNIAVYVLLTGETVLDANIWVIATVEQHILIAFCSKHFGAP